MISRNSGERRDSQLPREGARLSLPFNQRLLLPLATLGFTAFLAVISINSIPQEQPPSGETPTPTTTPEPTLTPPEASRLINGAKAIIENIQPGTTLTERLKQLYFNQGIETAEIKDCTDKGNLPGATYDVVNEVNLRGAPSRKSDIKGVLTKTPRHEPLPVEAIVRVESKIAKEPAIKEWVIKINPDAPLGEQLMFAATADGIKGYLLPTRGATEACTPIKIPDYRIMRA